MRQPSLRFLQLSLVYTHSSKSVFSKSTSKIRKILSLTGAFSCKPDFEASKSFVSFLNTHLLLAKICWNGHFFDIQAPVRFTTNGILTGAFSKTRFFEASFADLAQATRAKQLCKKPHFFKRTYKTAVYPFLIGKFELILIANTIQKQSNDVLGSSYRYFPVEKCTDMENLHCLKVRCTYKNCSNPIPYRYISESEVFWGFICELRLSWRWDLTELMIIPDNSVKNLYYCDWDCVLPH